MNTNKLVEEDIARAKQLQEMELIRDSLVEKIRLLQEESKYLEKQIASKEEYLETKTGKLSYIREEKEAVFNSLQNALNENRRLRANNAKNAQQKPKKTGGFLGGVLSYFSKETYDSIDVLGGKVKKTKVDVNQKNLKKEIEKPSESFFALNKNFSDAGLKQNMAHTPQKPSEKEPELPVESPKEPPQQKQSAIEIYTEERLPAETKSEDHPLSEETKSSATEPKDTVDETPAEKHEEDGKEVSDDESDELLKQIRENFDIVPE